MIPKKLSFKLALAASLGLGLCPAEELRAQTAAPGGTSAPKFCVLGYPLPLHKDMQVFAGINLKGITGAPLDGGDAVAMAPLINNFHRLYGAVELPESPRGRDQRIRNAYEAAAGDFDLWMTLAVRRAAHLYKEAMRAEPSSLLSAISELKSMMEARKLTENAYGAYVDPRILEAAFGMVNQYRWAVLRVAMERFVEEDAAKLLVLGVQDHMLLGIPTEEDGSGIPVYGFRTGDGRIGMFIPMAEGLEMEDASAQPPIGGEVRRVPEKIAAAPVRAERIRPIVRPQGASAARLRRFGTRFHQRSPEARGIKK